FNLLIRFHWLSSMYAMPTLGKPATTESRSGGELTFCAAIDERPEKEVTPNPRRALMKTADRTTNARVFALEMPHNKSGKSTPQPKIETRPGLETLPGSMRPIE